MKLEIAVGTALMLFVLGGVLSCSKNRAGEKPTDSATAENSGTANVRHRSSAAGNTSGSVAAANAPTNSLFKRIVSGEKALVTVPHETILAYLQTNASNAESLLVAFQASSNRNYLISAATNFPHDPRVQLAVLMNGVFPEQRATWIARFKQDAPDNPLPNYIAALDAFKAQQPQAALRELLSAKEKPHYRDYIVDNIQALEELYLADGRPPAEAKLAGMANVQMPHLKFLRDLGKDEVDLEKRYVAAGDQRSAEFMAADAVRMARQLSSGDGAVSLLSQLVGIATESSALKELPADARPSFLSTSAQERMAELQEQRQAIRDSAKFWDQWLGTASENDLIAYFDRLKLYGESGAMAWLQNRYAAANNAR
jgi:hypothetical protein